MFRSTHIWGRCWDNHHLEIFKCPNIPQLILTTHSASHFNSAVSCLHSSPRGSREAMKIGLPQYFPLSATVRQDKLDRSSADFSHGSWLQDESIDFVQNHLTVEGAFLPQNVLIVEARTATLIGLGQAPAVKSTLAGLRVSDKDLVFCPVNNSSDGSADSGSHWSVIFGPVLCGRIRRTLLSILPMSNQKARES